MIIDHTQSLLSALLKSHLTRTLPPRPPKSPKPCSLITAFSSPQVFVHLLFCRGFQRLLSQNDGQSTPGTVATPAPGVQRTRGEGNARRGWQLRGAGGAPAAAPAAAPGLQGAPPGSGRGAPSCPGPCPGSWVSTADALLSGLS